MIGQRFERLTVLNLVGSTRHHSRLWLCLCDCGTSTRVTTHALRSATTKSCGCLKTERDRVWRLKHGATSSGHRNGTPEYRAWRNAKTRCLWPSGPQWKDYGGRGIGMCDEWKTDFSAFLGHIGPKPSDDMVLDRIDNNGHYEPGNVRWVTHQLSTINRRPILKKSRHPRGRRFTLDGQQVGYRVMARMLAMSPGTLYERLNRVHHAS